MSAARARAIVQRRHPGDGPRRPDAADGDRARRLPRPGPHRPARARAVLDDALALQEAGCFSIVFEAIPSARDRRDHAPHGDPGHRHRRRARRPTARCSSSTTCSASTRASGPKFVKRYANVQDEMVAGVERLRRGRAHAPLPRRRSTPTAIAPEELERLRGQLAAAARLHRVNKAFTPTLAAPWPGWSQLFALARPRVLRPVRGGRPRTSCARPSCSSRCSTTVPTTASSRATSSICEQEGDRITHDIIQRLNSTFVTPIDREDIFALASALDDIVDFIEEVADFLGLYQIEAPMEQAQQLAHILLQADAPDRRGDAAAAHASRTSATTRSRSTGSRTRATASSREALASLFENGIDPMVVIRWKDIFERLEEAIDATRARREHRSRASSSRTR